MELNECLNNTQVNRLKVRAHVGSVLWMDFLKVNLRHFLCTKLKFSAKTESEIWVKPSAELWCQAEF